VVVLLVGLVAFAASPTSSDGVRITAIALCVPGIIAITVIVIWRAGSLREPVDLTGVWSVASSLASWYEARLKQTDNHMVGDYEFDDGTGRVVTGTLEGDIEGTILTFKWNQADNNRSGRGKLEISSSGDMMIGHWKYDTRPEGAPAGG